VVERGGYLHGSIAPEGPWCFSPPLVAVVTGTQEPTQKIDHDLSVYPNPTRGDFILEFRVPGNFADNSRIEIFNMSGKLIRTETVGNRQKLMLSLTGSPSGVYLIRLSSGNDHLVSRIVKQD
jgi:hypothetical protein